MQQMKAGKVTLVVPGSPAGEALRPLDMEADVFVRGGLECVWGCLRVGTTSEAVSVITIILG